MQARKPIAAALASIGLLVAGCSGSGSGTGAASSAPAGANAPAPAVATEPEPPQGVPAGTNPIPLPEKGQAYDNPQPRSNIRDGGTLRLPIPELGPNFNIFSVDGSSEYAMNIMGWIAPSLWEFTVTGKAFPNKNYLLSAKLISEDPETVEYTLNPKAKWNDGTPIDWTAFETTWKTQSGNDKRFNPASTDGYRSIGSVKKGEKDNQVIVTFKQPFYPYQMVFGALEHPRNADPDFYKTGWVDNLHPELLAGPFTVASLTDDRLVLERNPKWWGDSPKLDTIVYRKMDDTATINAFENGEIDTSTIDGGRATADDVKQISGMRDVQIRCGFYPGTSVYTMGQDSALFADKAAREAFVLGTNRGLLVKIRFEGMNWKEESPGSVMMYPWQDGYHDNAPDLHYDPKRAREILDADGWKMGADGYRHKNGKIAEFTYVTFGDDPTFIAMARAQQKMAQDIGLKMDIDVRPSSRFSQTLSKGDFDVVAMAWSAGGPFGYVFACQIYCSDSDSNYSRLGNARIDRLLKSITTYRDQAKALGVFNDAEEQALHLYGTFPLYNGMSQFAVRKGLANFGPAGFATRNPEDIGWQKASTEASASAGSTAATNGR